MTPAPRVLAPLASADVVVQAFKAEAKARHGLYRDHVLDSHRDCCRNRLCRDAQRLLDDVEDAERLVERAERIERARARP